MLEIHGEVQDVPDARDLDAAEQGKRAAPIGPLAWIQRAAEHDSPGGTAVRRVEDAGNGPRPRGSGSDAGGLEVEEVRHDPHRTDDPADDAITDERNAAVHAEALLEGDRSGPRGGAGVHELEARAERDSGGLQDAVAAEGKADLGGSGGERAGNGGGDHRRGPCRTLRRVRRSIPA